MSYSGKNASVRGHNASKGPVALWQLDGNMVDSIGGLNLSVSTGTEKYSQTVPGMAGFSFNGSTELARPGFDASLALAGDVTVECVARVGASSNILWSFGGNGSTEALNILYSLRVADSVNYLGMECLHEQGAGNSVVYDRNDCFPIYVPFHVAQVRSGNQYTLYLNGRQIGPASSVLTAPTGGTSSSMRVGGFFGSNFFNGVISSLIVYGRALSSKEVASDYNLTLGPAYGLYSP